MDNPKKRAMYLQMAENDITELMKGEKPRLIDEWQDAPQFWDAIRYHVDHEDDCGQFILTGSFQQGLKSAISQSLAGRTAVINVLP